LVKTLSEAAAPGMGGETIRDSLGEPGFRSYEIGDHLRDARNWCPSVAAFLLQYGCLNNRRVGSQEFREQVVPFSAATLLVMERTVLGRCRSAATRPHPQ
jgi:hypothetical protein